jgi:hypothetical protein
MMYHVSEVYLMRRLKFLIPLACVPFACIAFAGLAWAGTAYYGGFSDETGVPYMTGTPTGPILEARNSGWRIGVTDGTAIGAFTLNDGSTPWSIADDVAGMWVLTAEWDLPAPNAIEGRDHYFYIGFDAMAVDVSKTRLGTEWKDSDGDTIKEFVIREQAVSSPATEVVIPQGSHVQVRQTCLRGGDPVYIGSDAVFEEYRVNYGAWTPYLNAYGVTWIPLFAAGLDNQPHYITWKVRGLGGVIDPKITGTAVPNVNGGVDHDSDGVLDENDLWPGNAAGATDTDADGLPDEWETLYWGNLAQGTHDNPDGDILDNLEEWLGGTDPTVEDVFPLIGYVGAAALVTLLTAGGTTVLIRRKRK